MVICFKHWILYCIILISVSIISTARCFVVSLRFRLFKVYTLLSIATSGDVKKTQRILVQLLFATLLPCLTRKPFDGFNVIIVTNVSTITVFLWASNQMITLINSSLYVIAASNNLLVLYKKERQENFIYCTNFCVLNFIFPPWPHQPASHLTYCINFKNVSGISKKYLQELSKFCYINFWSQTILSGFEKTQARGNRENRGNMDQSA